MHLLGSQDCQIKIHNYAKPLWMAGATNRSARKRHSKRPKNNQRSFATSSITFSWSLVCTCIVCIVPLFRSLMKAFVAWTSIPPCKKTGLQTLRLTPNLKLIHVSLVLIGPWPNTHFQGLDPPPSPQTRGGLKGLGNSLEAWLVL